VPRAVRVLNGVVLLLFLAGAGVYLWAWTGMRRLETEGVAPDNGATSALERFDQLVTLSNLGISLALAAVVLAVLAAIATLVAQRRS
jgi:hypothetical protein